MPTGLTDFFILRPNNKGEKSSLDEKLLDTSERDFKVTVILAKHIELFGEIDLDKTPTKGSSFLKIIDENYNSLHFDDIYGNEFFGDLNESRELSSLNTTIRANDRIEAICKFDGLIQPILDSISFTANCPVIIKRLICTDIENKIDTISFIVPYNLKPFNFGTRKFYKPMVPIYALYREAKNSNSPFYKFLCYSKILEGIFKKLRPTLIKKAKSLNLNLQFKEENVPNDKRLANYHRKKH